MEMLVGEIIPVVSEKDEFKYRDQSIRLKYFFEFSDYRDYDERIRKIVVFSIESSYTKVKLPTETVMEEIKPIVVRN